MRTWVEARTAPPRRRGMSGDLPLPAELTYTRLFAGPDGASHFGKERIPFTPRPLIPLTPPVPCVTTAATQCHFLHLPGGYDGGWQPAFGRQFVFFLAGMTEIKASDGAMHRFLAGSVVLLDDTAGRGHRTRVVSAESALLAVVQLDD